MCAQRGMPGVNWKGWKKGRPQPLHTFTANCSICKRSSLPRYLQMSEFDWMPWSRSSSRLHTAWMQWQMSRIHLRSNRKSGSQSVICCMRHVVVDELPTMQDPELCVAVLQCFPGARATSSSFAGQAASQHMLHPHGSACFL